MNFSRSGYPAAPPYRELLFSSLFTFVIRRFPAFAAHLLLVFLLRMTDGFLKAGQCCKRCKLRRTVTACHGRMDF